MTVVALQFLEVISNYNLIRYHVLTALGGCPYLIDLGLEKVRMEKITEIRPSLIPPNSCLMVLCLVSRQCIQHGKSFCNVGT